VKLKPEFAPIFDVKDMINLAVTEFYIKMTIDGESYDPFSAETLKVLPPTAANAEYPEVAAMIQGGEVAMAIMWNAFYQDLMNPEKSPKVYDKFAVAPPPGVQKEDGSIERYMYVQTIALALNKNSKHKEEAMKFMAWATLGEGAEIYAKSGGSSPVKSVWQDDHILDIYPIMYPWVEEFGRAVPMHDKITDLMLIGSSWVQKVMVGSVTSEEAAKGMNDEINAYLE